MLFTMGITGKNAFLDKKKTAFRHAVFLGEGIFTMGYSKKYIMYWGVLREL